MKTWKFLFTEWKDSAREHPELTIGIPIMGAIVITFMILAGINKTNCQPESNGIEIVISVKE